MKKIAYINIPWAISLLFRGCAHDADSEMFDREVPLVNLNISVALSDISQSGTRASDIYPEAPVNDNEKMKTLRIIVVRNNDNIVEHNRIYNLEVTSTDCYSEPMKVIGNEKKRIYLFANEATEIKTTGFFPKRKLVECDFEKIQPGSLFFTDYISSLTIRLGSNMERIDGPLPMSGLYMVDVPAEDCERELSIMRAAVKFTFNITNKSSRSIEITKLTIDKMAEREYYLPHNATYIERETTEGTKFWDINSFDVPTLKGYYTYDASSLFKGQLLPGDENTKTNEQPIYLLEGKHSDDNNKENPYLLTLGVNGTELKSYLPNLPQLPRNTHVVVNITINEHAMDCIVDVRPYTEITLEPDFGL